MREDERQVAPTVDGIRRDHVARYEWLADRLPEKSRVLDVACGVGYGSLILAESGFRVVAVDRDAEAIAYAKEHYAHNLVTYLCRDATRIGTVPPLDVVACFETLEHLTEPLAFLRELRSVAPRLFVSVPNEDVFPYGFGVKYHVRHYTRAQLEWHLRKAGWNPVAWYGQAGPESDVEKGMNGRTLIAECERCAPDEYLPATEPSKSDVPNHVVILGLGPSLETYVDIVKRLGNRKRFSDEVWGINAVGDVIKCDRIFHMDDVRIQEIRAERRPDSNIAAMLEWLKAHPGPIYTSRLPEQNAYIGLVEYPLEEVINSCGFAYFNSTAAYAVAYAVHIGVKEISLFGCDFSYAKSHDAEKGRGCVEFHLGIAKARGVKIGLPGCTSLMDACAPIEERIYGYDAVHVEMEEREDEPVKVTFRPRESLPTADEIEARYDHSKPTAPQALIGGQCHG